MAQSQRREACDQQARKPTLESTGRKEGRVSPPSRSREAMTPQRVAVVIWRRKLVCVLVGAIVLIVGASWALSRPKVYESDSSVALLPVSTNSGVLPNYPNLITSLIPTYVQLVSSPALLDRVAGSLPFRTSADQLAKEVHGESLSDAAVINIVADNASPVRAQQIASGTTSAFLAQLRGNGVVIPEIYSQPTVPSQPAGPRTKLALAVVLAIAVFLGLSAGLVWDRLFGREDDTGEPAEQRVRPPEKRVRPPDQRVWPPGQPVLASEHAVRPPVLGIASELRDQAGAALAAEKSTDESAKETAASPGNWRAIRTNFIYATADRPAHSVMVTSLAPREGAATVAANLASSLAELGMAVVLVDADVRDPALHEVLGVGNEEGLTSAAFNGTDPESLLRPVPATAGLKVITAGPPLPAYRDESSLYLHQLPKITSLADLVVVVGPPLQGDGHAAVAAKATDGVVLVMRSGTGPAEPLETAQRMLRGGAPVLGTVLNRVTSSAVKGGAPGGEPSNVRIIRNDSSD